MSATLTLRGIAGLATPMAPRVIDLSVLVFVGGVEWTVDELGGSRPVRPPRCGRSRR